MSADDWQRVVIACSYELVRGRIEVRMKPHINGDKGVVQYAGVHFFWVDDDREAPIDEHEITAVDAQAMVAIQRIENNQ